jgi:hypothetical protein
MITMKKISAAVDKLAGSINNNVIKTGVHNSHKEFLNVMGVSLFFDK